MEKDALLEIILRDLQEVETLTQSFKGKNEISKVFYRLARNKLHSILDEIDVLEEIAGASQKIPQPPVREEKQPDIPNTEKANIKVPEQTNTIQPPVTATDQDKVVPQNTKQKEPQPEPVTPETIVNISSSETIDKEPPHEEIKTDVNTSAETSSTKVTPTPEKEKTEPETQQNKSSNVIQPNVTTKNNGRVLGEKLGTNKASFNEHIGKNQSDTRKKRSLTLPPVQDLKKALGINDRFFFQRELFGGNADVMNQTLDQLNQMNGIEDARSFLLANFHWDPEEDAVNRFLELVERRFL
ncbi:hypothetical protein ACT29H_00860 [Thermophagus sp. OGC60D27]|uniref:hypothetical protein n=1 Tax=Thermophagus sp. OGC60D27 TaxID=3458415 RepID=UPI0040380C2C